MVENINMCRYETHREMVARLTRIQERHPRIARVGSIGRSGEGRQLAYIKLSNNVNRVRNNSCLQNGKGNTGNWSMGNGKQERGREIGKENVK